MTGTVISSVLSSASVERVRAALLAAGCDSAIIELPGAARTAQAAADALGCSVAQIANSLVFRIEPAGEAVLAMTSGARRVDVSRVAELVGAPITKADASFVRETSGFAIGGVAPVGHARSMRTLIDENLARHAEIWAAAGHPHTVFRLDYALLVRLTGGTSAAFTTAKD